MCLKKIVLLLALGIAPFSLPRQTAYAHERWFVEQGQHPGEYFSVDWLNSLVVVATIFVIAATVVIHRSVWYHRIGEIFFRVQRWLPLGIEWRMVAILSGIMFIANAFTGAFLAPDLVLPGQPLAGAGSIIQLIIGFTLLSQLSFFLPGVLIVAVALPLAFIYLGPVMIADYLIGFVSLAAALGFFGMGANTLDRRLCKWVGLSPSFFMPLALPFIRIGTGLTLAILAIHNKLVTPDLALTFLDTHDLNFIAALGFPVFTNLRFVFAAGVAELTVSLLLVLGIATRLVAAILTMLLLTTMVIFGPGELIGHLPLFGIAVLLVYRGAGDFGLATPPALFVESRANAYSSQ